MSPLEILGDLIKIAKLIYDQAKLVESNNSRLQDLAECIQQVVTSLKGLDELPDNQQFIDNLVTMRIRFHSAHQLIQKILKQNSIKLFVKAGSNQHKIAECKDSIVELLPRLHLGLTAQMNINHARDRREDAAEHQRLLEQQKAHFQQLQAGQINKADLDDLVRRQMKSLVALRDEQDHPPIIQDKNALSKEYNVRLCDIIFIKKVADSGVGAIYNGSWHEQPVSIKWIERIDSEEDRLQFMREAKVLSRLRNDYITTFYGACFEKTQMCLLTSVMEQGDLHAVLSGSTLSERLQMAKDLSRGLAYLHAHNIIHGDINTKNIGINRLGQAKWTNFGLAKTHAMSLASIGVVSCEPAWQAPESWQRRSQLTLLSDIYSFGVLLWTLMTGVLPFEKLTSSEIVRRVKEGRREEIPEGISPEWASIIRACWSLGASDRPMARDIAQALQNISLPVEPIPVRPPSPTGEELYELGISLQKNKDMVSAYRMFERSCEKGYFKSYTSVGLFKLEGLGGQAVDKKSAVRHLEYAAGHGHARAMFNLGRIYEKGDAGEGTRDAQKALDWYSQASELDESDVRSREKAESLKKSGK